MTSIYDKPFLTPALQIEILKSHGLAITDKEKAIRWLRRIGYYRLTGYLYPFREADGAFLEGTSIEHALSLYAFDKKLRLLVLDVANLVFSQLTLGNKKLRVRVSEIPEFPIQCLSNVTRKSAVLKGFRAELYP